jgi:hypothetical protein
MKHTPGPWQHWGYDVIVKDTDGNDVVICGVGKPANTRWHCYSETSPQQTKANICLISAAPDLLEAARMMADLVDDLLVQAGANYADELAAARAAIAKAEGGAA